MNVLVINCGSSSLKFQLIDAETENLIAKGLCERIGIEGSRLVYSPIGGEKVTIEEYMPDHTKAVQMVLDALTNEEYGVVKSLDEIGAVGHRLVHGGEKFACSTLVTDEVIEAIKECNDLAPLHNPANLIGIDACRKLMPNVPMAGIFDTAFHQTMPSEAYMYALPYEYYTKHGIRKYGFHGTSHKYVAERCAALMEKPIEDLKIITCHIGNGGSIAAVKGGKCMDTSMGFTPLDGLEMGTRSGILDPAVVLFLMDNENLSSKDMNTVLNKKSGLAGVSGVSSDMRDVTAAAKEGNERAKLALDIFAYRVKSYIGQYAAVMNGVDAIVFTAGIGENDIATRLACASGLEYLGVSVDADKNNVRGGEVEISADGSKVKVFVISTNEELAIARETARLTK